MDRPKWRDLHKDWVEYADWLEAENAKLVSDLTYQQVISNLFQKQIFKMEAELARIKPAAQAVVDERGTWCAWSRTEQCVLDAVDNLKATLEVGNELD
jgi:hypothetical protein